MRGCVRCGSQVERTRRTALAVAAGDLEELETATASDPLLSAALSGLGEGESKVLAAAREQARRDRDRQRAADGKHQLESDPDDVEELSLPGAEPYLQLEAEDLLERVCRQYGVMNPNFDASLYR